MSRDLHPTDGARYLLERDAELAGGSQARYRASVYTPTEVFASLLVLTDNGDVALAEGATAMAEPHWSALQMFAKLTARSVPKRREDELPAWPARVLRWRGPGRGG